MIGSLRCSIGSVMNSIDALVSLGGVFGGNFTVHELTNLNLGKINHADAKLAV